MIQDHLRIVRAPSAIVHTRVRVFRASPWPTRERATSHPRHRQLSHPASPAVQVDHWARLRDPDWSLKPLSATFSDRNAQSSKTFPRFRRKDINLQSYFLRRAVFVAETGLKLQSGSPKGGQRTHRPPQKACRTTYDATPYQPMPS
jgi:hypothetical protein